MGSDPSFDVHSRLGAGGMGEVFLATARGGKRTRWVALKRLRAEISDQQEYQNQFEREARICSVLAHENIVALEGFGRDALGPYLALQYVEGTSAARLVTGLRALGEPVPLGAAYSIAQDAARGLEYAHQLQVGEGQRGIIHRDISPDNVLIDRTGIAKLADFGIAKLAGGTSMTRTGTVKGKFAYMAPELFDGQDATVESDVFSFGATLYFVLCAVSPFQGRTEAELVRAVLSATAPPPSAVRQGIPPRLDAWIVGALSKVKRERPALAELFAVLAELADAKRGRAEVAQCVARVAPQILAPPEPVASRGTREARRDAGKRRPRTWLIALGTACVAGGVGTWVGRSLRTEAPPPAVATAASAPATANEPAPPGAVAAPSLAKASETAPPGGAGAPSLAKANGPPPPGPALAPAPASEPPPAKARALTPAPVAAEAADPVAPSPPVERTGSVLIKVRPWARVFFDGKPRGVTPMKAFEARSGTHALVLVNDDLKVRRAYTVHVRPGRETELHYSLDAPEPAPAE